MKKLIFPCVFILASCLVFTCSPFSPDGFNGETLSGFPGDKRAVTIYLDGRAPVSASRAINRDLAMMSCDYFEVTFLYNVDNTPANNIVARGDWRIGEGAGVSGVYRVGSVDYGDVSSSPAVGTGSAILFAGKSDRTLLAIGRLVMVDGQPNTIITPDSTSVTFTLDALTAGVSSSAGNSSFLTAARDEIGNYQNVNASNTNVFSFDIAGRSFPLFRLEHEIADIKAEYNFRLHSAGDFSAYYSGLRIAAPCIIEKKQPHYTLPNGSILTKPVLVLDEKTEVQINNNNTPGASFNETLEFTFNTAATVNGSMFSFVFSIPVYALSNANHWYIRPGYGTNRYDLDDGLYGTGGAVLIGTGAIELSGELRIAIIQKPNKWQYTKDGDRRFDVTGLVVELQFIDGTAIRTLRHDELNFLLGPYYIPDPWEFGEEWYGNQEVIVEHIDVSGKIYRTTFCVLVSGKDFDFSNIPVGNFFHVDDATASFRSAQFRDIINNAANNGAPPNQTSVIIVHGSFNIDDSYYTGDPRLIFIVAAAPNVVIGRQASGNGALVRHYTVGRSFLNAYYFGMWPYSVPLNDGSNFITTYPYTVYAGGIYENLTSPPAVSAYTSKLLTDGWISGGITNVKSDSGVTIVDRHLLN